MPRFAGGWIKLWRSVNDHWIGHDLLTLGLWTKLLIWALREPSKVLFDGAVIQLERGQVLTSLADLAKALGCSRNAIDRHLKRLEDSDAIRTRKGHGGRIITIVNYDVYQAKEDLCETPRGQDEDAARTPRGREGAHNREDKKTRRDTPPSPPSKSGPSPFDFVLAEKWAAFAQEQQPHLKPRVSDYAESVRKMRELDGYPEDFLDELFVFVRKDDFWRKVALSPTQLRQKNKSGLPKISSVIAAMQRDQHVKQAAGAFYPAAKEDDFD
jgi:biotin operon repressor